MFQGIGGCWGDVTEGCVMMDGDGQGFNDRHIATNVL